MRYGTTRPSTSVATSWFAGAVVSFTYDGTYWQMNDYTDNTTYSAMSQTEASTGTATTGRLITAKVLHDTIEELDTDTWQANTQAQDGYVVAGGSNNYTYWGTDGSGNPSWNSIYSNLFSYVRKTSAAKTITANNGAEFSLTGMVPSGYKEVGVTEVRTNHPIACSIGRWNIDSSTGTLYVTVSVTASSNSQSVTVTATVISIRA